MARDKPDGRERREGRERDRGRKRVDDHDDRAGGDLRERLRAVETLAADTAHLASTSAFRFGGYAASKGRVYFVSGDLKERLSRRWTEWKRTASLEPSQRPTANRSLGNSKFMMLLLNGWLALLLMGLLGQTTLRLQGCWKRSLGGGSRLKRRIMVIRLMANLGLLSSLTVALKTARGSRMPGLQKRFAGALVLARSWGLGRLGTCLVGRTSACSSTYPTKAGERLDNGGRPSVKASTVAVLSEGNTHMLELEDWIFCSVKAFLVVVGAVRLITKPCLVPVPSGPARRKRVPSRGIRRTRRRCRGHVSAVV
eukprot:s7126_g3.t1